MGGRRNPLTSARKVQALCPVCSASWRRTVRLTGCVTSGHLRHLSASVSLLVKWGGGVTIASIHESNREFNQVMAVKQSLSFLSYKLCDLDGVSHVTSEPPLH